MRVPPPLRTRRLWAYNLGCCPHSHREMPNHTPKGQQKKGGRWLFVEKKYLHKFSFISSKLSSHALQRNPVLPLVMWSRLRTQPSIDQRSVFLFVFLKNSTVFLIYIWNRTKTKFDMHWISKCAHSFWLAAIFVLCQSTLMHELQKCVLNFSEGIKKPALITEQRKACKAGGSVSVSFKVLKASFYCHKNLALKSETKGVPPQWSMNVLSKPPTVPHTIFLLHKKQKQKDPNCFLMVAPVESLYQHCNWSFLKRDLKMLGCMLLMQSFELCEAVRLQVC